MLEDLLYIFKASFIAALSFLESLFFHIDEKLWIFFTSGVILLIITRSIILPIIGHGVSASDSVRRSIKNQTSSKAPKNYSKSK